MAEVAPAPPAPFDPTTFDPWLQNVTMYAPDGSILVVNMEMVNFYRLYTARRGISFGSQIGSSFMLLLVLVLLTRTEKRKSLIFILNALCLFTNTARTIFSACYLTGNIMHPYGLLSGAFRATTTDLAVSITTNTLSFIVLALVMGSLSLQVWVACVTTGPIQRVVIMGATTAMALISLGFKFAFMVATHIATVQLVDRGQDRLSAWSWITQAVAILLYSCVFTWKLGCAIVQRRRLNMLQFGPMQIVFIMGCQTMFIPALISVIQFYEPLQEKVPEFGNMVLTVVCIFLPLSAIWAGVANDSPVADRSRDAHHRLINSEFGRGSSPNTTVNSTATFEKSRQMSCSTCAYTKKGDGLDTLRSNPAGTHSKVEDDVILVDHEYAVHREAIPMDRV
ncbi:fungal pheromone mating factor STE2 GPCR-domain-containing protein [Boeremia exigua]|uniref:fungal pheromone mating factor STE2 GPCR-domain-containing protein n=1 Tax=Boeremia exigua TaxID=749465 RepID=UPI001E8EE59C|nr:fungal pheromone mating factor STE2 GPCR-domain-containing protein [Boeremia exigua]KAH6625302.1 fungal pheromone mating factor STE2 GPCR-domain-containing protein [Boeremia exigua]